MLSNLNNVYLGYRLKSIHKQFKNTFLMRVFIIYTQCSYYLLLHIIIIIIVIRYLYIVHYT